MKLTPKLALLALLLASPAAGDESTSVDSRREIYARLDHDMHIGLAGEKGCATCHDFEPVLDAAGNVDPISTFLPRTGACHTCHAAAEPRRTRGPTRCTTCHEQAPTPTTHGAGWLSLHGAEARTGSCSDCHRSRTCVGCHEQRESIRFDVHDRTWLSVHGIAARADPSSCSSCHLQAGCVSCHASTAGAP